MHSRKSAAFTMIGLLVLSNLTWAYFYWHASSRHAAALEFIEELRREKETFSQIIVASSAGDSQDDVRQLLQKTFPEAVISSVSDDEFDSLEMNNLYFDFKDGKLENVW